jgi:hypothetical protein
MAFADLFRPKWKHSGWRARVGAAAKLSDHTLAQGIYARIAKTEKDWWVRKYAVEKLTRQAVLSDIAKTDKEWQVREAAVKNLTGQGVLAKIDKIDKHEYVRRAAKKRLQELRK